MNNFYLLEQNHSTNMFLSFELRYVCIFKYDVNPILEFLVWFKNLIPLWPRSHHWKILLYWYPDRSRQIFLHSRWCRVKNIRTIEIKRFYNLYFEHSWVNRRNKPESISQNIINQNIIVRQRGSITSKGASPK